MSDQSKITASHVDRQAVIYVRQSTVAQTRANTESLEGQYELTRRATELGWPASQVMVVDEDLGRSGAEASARSGFQSLVAATGLGRVGLILGIEVSRLARNNADWYQLLDLCALTDTLIADADGIYHPADYSDRLVLGLKGTMSEAELHLLRGRLLAGVRHKAAKGELRVMLPAGYDYDADDRVVVCADEAEREAVATVFGRFAELGSARQVMISLRQDGLELPRRRAGGRIVWAPAGYGCVFGMLTNPCYAGAYVFGRTRAARRLGTDGRLVGHKKPLPMSDWRVLITDHHPGYLSWQAFEDNQARLQANCSAPKGEAGGAVREGPGLLQGILRCGRCGRMMRIAYQGGKKRVPRYYCSISGTYMDRQIACQSMGGRQIEQAVLSEVFTALQPAALAATARALADAETARADRLRLFEVAVERARFDAERTRRQYDGCEPENRLVARSLEAAWEARLAGLAAAQANLAAEKARQPSPLSADELAWLGRAGADLRAVFDAASTTARERKQLIRALLVEVAVTVDKPARTAELKLCWEGGASTGLTVDLPRLGAPWRKTSTSTVELVRRLAADYDDATIAGVLARQDRRTGSGLVFTKARVAQLRRSHDIPAFPGTVTPGGQDGDVVSITKAAAELGVGISTIYRWIADGFIVGEQLTPGAPWQIRLTDTLRAKVREDAPPGWLPLREAAAALGVARQTVLHKVQRGELAAVHVRRGRRSGLRIQVKPDQAGLFENP